MKRIRKGDEVIVIAGKVDNKGQRGTVLKVTDTHVVIEGINKVFKHIKPNHQLQREGSIEKKEAPIHISNVMLFNPSTGRVIELALKLKTAKNFASINLQAHE